MAVEFVVVSALEPILTVLLKRIAPSPDLVTFSPFVAWVTVPPNVVCPAAVAIIDLVAPTNVVLTPIVCTKEELFVKLPDNSSDAPAAGVKTYALFVPLKINEEAWFGTAAKNTSVKKPVSSKVADVLEVGATPPNQLAGSFQAFNPNPGLIGPSHTD